MIKCKLDLKSMWKIILFTMDLLNTIKLQSVKCIVNKLGIKHFTYYRR